jgi:DNA-binding transcriptional MerR regulator/phospholipid N-methyltransferase
MQDKSIYTTGEFAKRANVSVRTIRYYDDKNLLKPSEIKESGYRYYTDLDFIKLQQIIVLKRLGFSLEDIAEISSRDNDSDFIRESFQLQLKLIQSKLAELRLMEQTITEANEYISISDTPDWNKLISMIHLLNMEETLADQYKNSVNVDARINLHHKFSLNPQGWYCWIYDLLSIKQKPRILEVGCGNGQLWKDNLDRLPAMLPITLSDISSGMLRNAQENLKEKAQRFLFECFDLQNIPYEDQSFDLIIANHVLFYAKDREKALKELSRVLKKGGCLCCSTYGKQHMKEIELLVKEYDERIALSEVKLFDIFGLDYGQIELSRYFSAVERHIYEDSLLVTELNPLADYIYSCHGNQRQLLSGKKSLFEQFLKKKLGRKGLRITKDAGVFLCRKE